MILIRTLDHQKTLQWSHNERDGVSNHKPHDCLLNRLFKARIKQNIKAPRHWHLCGELPAQRASNTENVSIWWRHHEHLLFGMLNTANVIILIAA